MTKVIFMGTPDFAIPTLAALHNHPNYSVVCVVTQPDKPTGRGATVTCSPVKQFALEHNIPVLQPEKISTDISLLANHAPDVIVTCAFGQMLKQNVLDLAPHGVINVHASLLPKYRGSSPIQWAVINGEKRTGVTIMRTALAMDTGDIILKKSTAIHPDETAEQLFNRLAPLGATALITALDKITTGRATYTPQDHSQATTFPMLTKADGHIKWHFKSGIVRNFIRGMNSWPMAFFNLRGETIRVHSATEFGREELKAFLAACEQVEGRPIHKGLHRPGTVLHASPKHGLYTACKVGALRLDIIQPANGKPMPATAYLNGRTIPTGVVCN